MPLPLCDDTIFAEMVVIPVFALETAVTKGIPECLMNECLIEKLINRWIRAYISFVVVDQYLHGLIELVGCLSSMWWPLESQCQPVMEYAAVSCHEQNLMKYSQPMVVFAPESHHANLQYSL